MKFIPGDDPLESALRRDAARLAPLTPAGMERRIAEAAGRSSRPGPSVRPLYVWPALAAMGCAALLVVAIRSRQPASDSAADRAAAAQLAQAVKAMPAQIWERMKPQAEAALREEPLRQEATALYADARSALGFLALNFLPESTPGPAPRRSEG